MVKLVMKEMKKKRKENTEVMEEKAGVKKELSSQDCQKTILLKEIQVNM